MRNSLLVILLFLLPFLAQGQDRFNPAAFLERPHVFFEKHPDQRFGLDVYQYPHDFGRFEKLEISRGVLYPVGNKSISPLTGDKVLIKIRNIRRNDRQRLEFQLSDTLLSFSYKWLNDSTAVLELPGSKRDYEVYAELNEKRIGQLNVFSYVPLQRELVVVSTLETKIDTDLLEEKINSIYRQCNLSVKVRKQIVFSDSVFNNSTVFDNPGWKNDRYTRQMRDLRDRFFESYPGEQKDAYYLFVIPAFTNPELKGFMVRNKAMGFFSARETNDEFYTALARELARGIGILDHYPIESKSVPGTTQNLMDTDFGSDLNLSQWERLRHSSNSYSFYDSDEDVKTNNGMVAYYFWEEDENGFIRLSDKGLLNGIARPFKKNYLSYHLNISDVMFSILFSYNTYFICYWHVVVWSALLVFWIIFRWFILRKIRKLPVDAGKIKLRIIKWISGPVFIGLVIGTFFLINEELRRYEVNSGVIEDFQGHSLDHVKNNILNNTNLRYRNENELSSEILVNKGDEWQMKRRKRVLYFDVFKDSLGVIERCRFIHDSDSLLLKTLGYQEKAESHYMVFNIYAFNDSLEAQKAYNHVGIEISNKLEVSDPAKRILLFVNGYRPTSIGHSFEENFSGIRENGIEFPQSSNLIYSFDRYDYWRPWNEIDLRFKRKINAEDVYYADGHHSVSTSNYRSILNFTRVSTQYPKKCRNPKGHTCHRIRLPSTGIMGDKTVDTYTMLPTDPNVIGFNERKRNGKIAARNLYMMLNEIPNRSDNDTLYIVAHSMGYAYALGMIEELRGKIRFGGFYIIAPENALQGTVNPHEWQEVWQYGSKWSAKEKDAPCLQDGIAPQSKAGGLTEKHRSYIPENKYRWKGFFDAHFVGYYTWIFDLKEEESGYIRQR